MAVSFKHIARRTTFYNLPRVQHHDPVAGLTCKGQIVQYKDTTCAAFTRQLQDESDNLGLDRDIQRRGRLVGQKQIGAACQCDRHHDTLLHAPR